MILDGFDLGVGILLLFQRGMTSRDHMVDSITPTWDGNETWIIMAGVTLLAAFPVAYSILSPAFYLPVILMLLALGFRGVFRVPYADEAASSSMGYCVCSRLASRRFHAPLSRSIFSIVYGQQGRFVALLNAVIALTTDCI